MKRSNKPVPVKADRPCEVAALGGFPECPDLATGSPVVIWIGPLTTDDMEVDLCEPHRKIFLAATAPFRGAA